MNTLFIEINLLRHISSYLSAEDLVNFSSVNKICYLACIDSPVWSKKLSNFSKHSLIEALSPTQRRAYISCCQLKVMYDYGDRNFSPDHAFLKKDVFCPDKSLDQMPDVVEMMPMVETIIMFYNRIKTLSNTFFSRLTNLRHLDLMRNELTCIPINIGLAANLTHLQLSSNCLTHFPTGILMLKKLKVLSINHNQIPELPELICMLDDLEELHVADNLLITLPESIGSMTKLKLINVSYNMLQSLPDSFRKLTELEVLFADNNKIQTFPESVCGMENLMSLSLGGNLLREISRSIGMVKKLVYLCCADNLLTSFPLGICRLRALEMLDLGGNEIFVEELYGQYLQTMENLHVLHIGTDKIHNGSWKGDPHRLQKLMQCSRYRK